MLIPLPHIRAGKTLLLRLGLLVLAAAAICLAAYSWRQETRPGKIRFARGLDYAAARQMSQAEEQWVSGAQEDPHFPDNFSQLGDLYSAQGRFSEAAARYAAATRLSPQDVALFQHLAGADASAGNSVAALAAAGRAAALRPEDAGIVGGYGIRAAQLNQPVLALPSLKRAHTLSPENADYLLYLVRVEFQLHDLAGVEHDLTPFVASHPENAEASYLMASLLYQLPQTSTSFTEALKYAKRAQVGAPGNDQASVLLGQLFLASKNPMAALQAFQLARAAAPHSLPALQGLAACYLQLHQPGPAARAAAKLTLETSRRARSAALSDRLNANPADKIAALELAHIREENGELLLAESYYRRAVRHSPQDPHLRAALKNFLRRTPSVNTPSF